MWSAGAIPTNLVAFGNNVVYVLILSLREYNVVYVLILSLREYNVVYVLILSLREYNVVHVLIMSFKRSDIVPPDHLPTNCGWKWIGCY